MSFPDFEGHGFYISFNKSESLLAFEAILFTRVFQLKLLEMSTLM